MVQTYQNKSHKNSKEASQYEANFEVRRSRQNTPTGAKPEDFWFKQSWTQP